MIKLTILTCVGDDDTDYDDDRENVNSDNAKGNISNSFNKTYLKQIKNTNIKFMI